MRKGHDLRENRRRSWSGVPVAHDERAPLLLRADNLTLKPGRIAGSGEDGYDHLTLEIDLRNIATGGVDLPERFPLGLRSATTVLGLSMKLCAPPSSTRIAGEDWSIAAASRSHVAMIEVRRLP